MFYKDATISQLSAEQAKIIQATYFSVIKVIPVSTLPSSAVETMLEAVISPLSQLSTEQLLMLLNGMLFQLDCVGSPRNEMVEKDIYFGMSAIARSCSHDTEQWYATMEKCKAIAKRTDSEMLRLFVSQIQHIESR